MTRKVACAAIVGVAAGAAVWYVTSPRATSDVATRASTTPAELRGDEGASVAGAPLNGGETHRQRDRRSMAVGRVAPSNPSSSPRPVDWDEPRDETWAGPMEQALGGLGSDRLGQLLPEASFRAVGCRRTTCTLEIACRADSVDMCQNVASVLVLVDGMTLRIRQQVADAEGWVPVLVDVSLPPGDAEEVTSAMTAELAQYPDVTERIASYLATLRRERAEAEIP